MKKIIKIAQLELSNLFYSPIAWVLLIIFTFQAAHAYVYALTIYQKGVFLGRTDYSNFTTMLFSSGGVGVFQEVKTSLFLYIPLLTMGLISKELSSGSIKLLLSSPIKNQEIVFGKFLSMMIYGLLLMAILSIFLVISTWYVPHFDIPAALAGLLGLYLLLCAYAAIGLFLSSLSSYQVIVALFTLVTLALLNYIGQVGQRIDFVRDITYFLSIAGRVDYFIFGLISSKDVFYFLIVIAIFLGLTIIKLQLGRESKPLYVKVGRYLLLFIVTLTLGYLSSRPGSIWYYDATATKTLTLTKNSQQILAKIKEPATMTTYVNLLNTYAAYYGMPENVNIDKSRFEQYTRYLPDLKMDYVYYWDRSPDKVFYKRNPGLTDAQLAEKVATSDDRDLDQFLTPEQMRKVLPLEEEDYKFVRQISYQGKKTFLRIFDDQERHPGEQEITAAFARLINKAPIAAFLQGNGERKVDSRRDEDYLFVSSQKAFRYALINQGYEVVQVQAGQAIPSDVSVLVMADPQEAYIRSDLNKVKDYIQQGGNLLLCAEKAHAAANTPLLSEFGLRLTDQVFEPSKDYAPDMVFGKVSPAAIELDSALAPLVNAETSRVSMPGVAVLEGEHTGFHAIPVLQNQSGRSLALALKRQVAGKEQRILVFGDADFLSNSELGRIATGNFDFYPIVFRWLSNSVFPIKVDRPAPPDSKLTITKEQISTLNTGLLILLPALLLAIGAGILIRRKRR